MLPNMYVSEAALMQQVGDREAVGVEGQGQ